MRSSPFLFSLFLVCALFGSCSSAGRYIQISGYAQGGTYSVKIGMDGVKETPQDIKADIDSILLLIDNSLSGYNKGSTLSRLNAGESVQPEGIFRDIYSRSYSVWEETGGAFDVAAGALFDIWGFGFSSDSLPSPEKIRQTLSESGMKRLVPSITEEEISPTDLLKEGLEGVPPRLNFNAIAQGYSCDLVASYLYSIGVKDMLVDIGEIFCDGLNPSGLPWSIGIDRPYDGNDSPGEDLSAVWISDGSPCGLVTSGNYRKFYIKDGVKYSHTIDPRNGYPVTHSLLSATIVAPDTASADAYATYCMVVGLNEARAFIESRPDLEAFLIYDDNGRMESWKSPGFTLRGE